MREETINKWIRIYWGLDQTRSEDMETEGYKRMENRDIITRPIPTRGKNGNEILRQQKEDCQVETKGKNTKQQNTSVRLPYDQDPYRVKDVKGAQNNMPEGRAGEKEKQEGEQ